jgi:hypothetical protein
MPFHLPTLCELEQLYCQTVAKVCSVAVPVIEAPELMDRLMPDCRARRDELKSAPLTHEACT